MNNKPTFKKENLKMPEERFGLREHHEEHPSLFGIILSILIVALICILGGLYAWSEIILKNKQVETPTLLQQRPTQQENNEPESTNAEAQVETLGAMSTSDDIGTIESDLEGTTLAEESLDGDLQSVDAELAP